MESTSTTGSDGEQKREPIQSFEDILNIVGIWSTKTICIFVLSALTSLVSPLPVFSIQFLGDTPQHWCDVPELSSANWTQDDIRIVAIPYDNATSTFSSCTMYDLNYSELSNMSLQEAKRMALSQQDEAEKVPCYKRNFEENIESITTQWDLVCERRVLYSTTQAANQLGVFLSSIIMGYFLDRFGRMKVYRACALLYVTLEAIGIFSPSVGFYIACKIGASLLTSTCYLGGFVLVMEMCTPSQRTVVGNYWVLPWTAGMMITAGIAYIVRPWQYLQLALLVPSLILIINCWLLPESPRWLILNSKYDDAYNVLLSISKSGGKSIPTKEKMIDYMKEVQCKCSEECSDMPKSWPEHIAMTAKHFAYLLMDPCLRRRTIPIFTVWFSVALVYYGVALGGGNFGFDKYLFLLIGGLVEIPSYLFLWPTVLLLKRKWTLLFLFIGCSLSIFLVLGITLSNIAQGLQALKMTLFLVGKFAITAAFHLLWMFTAELYPTKYRSMAIGQGSTLSRIGSVCSPYINDLLALKVSWGPSALFGFLSLLGGVVCAFIPDTSDQVLPDSAAKTSTTSGTAKSSSDATICSYLQSSDGRVDDKP